MDLDDGREPGHVLARGHDFYASPRLSPDGNWLTWLAWDHPNMPWNGTLLYLAEIDAQGALGSYARREYARAAHVASEQLFADSPRHIRWHLDVDPIEFD